MSKLWSGRFSKETDRTVQKFSESISYDYRLYPYDIQGSIAHAKGLLKAGILKPVEFSKISEGLKNIEKDITKGNFSFKAELEDIHMNIEAELTTRIGDCAKKLHTGRSRNDQVATDIRLYLKDHAGHILELLEKLMQTLHKLAEQQATVIMPGYTHMQIAQPVLFAHHLLAYVEMFIRDKQRLQDVLKRINVMPLGSAALAGTTYRIDRKAVAKDLGFAAISENSMDAVSDRDFMVEFLAVASLMAVHLSRMSEEIILWNTTEFKFIELDDGFTTGSSIMPQKKNPDVAELVRGKTGRVVGNLVALLTTLKGLPLTYNRDMQEDKERLFDTVETITMSLIVMQGLWATIKINQEAMYQAALKGYATATDLADYLVRKGLPFREAHEIVGRIVRYGVEQELTLPEIPLEKYQKESAKFENDVYQAISPEASINARNIYGGTSFSQVKAALKRAKKRISE
jgi:argininosuccinate lyase